MMSADSRPLNQTFLSVLDKYPPQQSRTQDFGSNSLKPSEVLIMSGGGHQSGPTGTHQRGHGEHLHRQVGDRELAVMVISDVVVLQPFIVLQEWGGQRDSSVWGYRRRRPVLTTVGTVKS
ncbi:hypothetical protein ILYODFUR_022980 [Ilyodon furcidens]|uniref:Uncharacterized protein n=1 Tax=Ilyodon furcidens TaxID=33524 RepID=A0ABV0U149_9TELE